MNTKHEYPVEDSEVRQILIDSEGWTICNMPAKVSGRLCDFAHLRTINEPHIVIEFAFPALWNRYNNNDKNIYAEYTIIKKGKNVNNRR